MRAAGTPAEAVGYATGMAVTGGLLFVSGQTPEGPRGLTSSDPEEQLRQIWRNVATVLAAAGLGFGAVVQVRTFLASRDYRDISSRIRREVFGRHEPALAVVICELYEAAWIAEIEVVAELPAGSEPTSPS